jgi:acetyltransferase-like isoleucine patch superfamily enzyme
MSTSFYSDLELSNLGLMQYGENVLISKKASLYSPEKISIGNNVRIDDFCILSGKITIGSYVHISAYNALYGHYGIVMGDFSGLSPRCTVFSGSDDFGGDFLIGPMVPEEYTHVMGGLVLIKRFVQIGAGSIVLPKLTIHEGAAIGALSLVKKDIPEWTIYAGSPIKYIKARNKGLLKKLNKIYGTI